MPNRIDYTAWVHAALRVFAGSANDLYHTLGANIEARRTNNVVTIYVNRIPVCQVKVEGL